MSRHKRQRWMPLGCKRTFGEKDMRLIDAATKELALAMYAEGIAARKIERLLKVSHNTVLIWVRKEIQGKALQPVAGQDVQVVEADEMWSFIGTKKSSWLWLAIYRGSHRIVELALGDRGTSTAKVLLPQLPQAQHLRYCTDQHKPYRSIIARAQHTVGKAHTHHIESLNNKLRWYLALLHRKTHASARAPRRSCTHYCLCGVGSLVLNYSLRQVLCLASVSGITISKHFFSNPKKSPQRICRQAFAAIYL